MIVEHFFSTKYFKARRENRGHESTERVHCRDKVREPREVIDNFLTSSTFQRTSIPERDPCMPDAIFLP